MDVHHIILFINIVLTITYPQHVPSPVYTYKKSDVSKIIYNSYAY